MESNVQVFQACGELYGHIRDGLPGGTLRMHIPPGEPRVCVFTFEIVRGEKIVSVQDAISLIDLPRFGLMKFVGNQIIARMKVAAGK